ncbi:MAG TPA: SAM-dependent methyltransferase [Puia sp.]|nr:SAM-dependent methyltransferase [Puia sp.]
MPLPEIIADVIHRQGPLSFRDFMEMALYHPGEGYYTSSRERTGRSGDFYTSPYLTHLFGDMIGGQLEEMWAVLGSPAPFTVVECGPGTGLLCADILGRLQQNKTLFDHMEYVLIEKSPGMREKEKCLLSSKGLLDKVRWAPDLGALDPVTGCILSNELIDNFAVHRVLMEDRLMEIFVDYANGFTEIFRPAGAELQDYLRQLGVTLPRGFRAEINLEATQWIRRASAALVKGFVLTIDYGNSSSALYRDKAGTLTCYHRHAINHDPYLFIGEQDITTHVNFSALDLWGRREGLGYCGYTSQARFLQGLGLNRRLQEWERSAEAAGAVPDGEARQALLRQLYTLLVQMGNSFKVLIQRKGVGRVFLSGLQFTEQLA